MDKNFTLNSIPPRSPRKRKENEDAPRPLKTTLEFIRQFARVYHFDARVPIQGIALN